MALEGASSSQTSRWKYHVFLSFMGKDTRKSFTDHLYAALKRKGIKAFRDDNELHRGQVISNELLQAIQQSLSAIVILSPNYASSTWCLDELSNILESKTILLGHKAYPVFYGVDPSDVRYLKGSFGEAFNKHEERFGGDKYKVQRWKDALKHVASISGWDSRNRHEAELIEDIVEKIWTKLETNLPSPTNEVVGIDSRVKELESLLSIRSQDVHFIGIFGMGGVGKSTLARVIYERIYDQFDIFCFLPNISREVSNKSDGLVHLQRKLLSPININTLEIIDSYDGKKKIRNYLCTQKVLLVLDDISCTSQLENLAENPKWFGPGSRIIITTRDVHLLKSHGVSKRYEVRVLNFSDSLQLFSKKAFKRDQPLEGYLDFSKTVVKNAGGLPLALKVLGSSFCGRSLSEWEEYVQRVRQDPPKFILDILRISYDGLEEVEKTLFLDIAFFFIGRRKDDVTQILKDCGFYPTIGINILIEKSLVTCDRGILEMHELLQEMARNVVYQESPNDVSRRSRLCSSKDVNQVVKYNKGTNSIQGMILKSNELFEAHPEAFSNMYNLKVFIILADLTLPRGLKCLSSSLNYLEWEGYPLQYLPLDFPLDELVHLRMHCSKIKCLWKGNQYFRRMKSIDLSGSENLIKTPNISPTPCLERLILKECTNLVEVHHSIGKHKKLVILNLKGCRNLKTLPKKLEMDALQQFILSGCSKVKRLPEFGVSMECMSKLNVNGCEKLVGLPQSIYNLKSLRKLKMNGCSRFSMLPDKLNENIVLEELELSGCVGLLMNNNSASSFQSLPTKRVIGFTRCPPIRKDLKFSPLSAFYMVKKLHLCYCNLNDDSIPDDLGLLSSLEEMNLSHNNFVHLSASIGNLSRLIRLHLHDCPELQTLRVLPSNVQRLAVTNCNQLEPIFFDPQRIRKILEVNSWSLKSWIWFIIPGSEIPPWFDNQYYFSLDPQLLLFACDCECHRNNNAFTASMIVDIPDYCLSSEWWGIVVCLALDITVKPRSDPPCKFFLQWASKASDDDSPIHVKNSYSMNFSGRHLFFTVFECGDSILQPVRLGDQNKLQLIVSGLHRCMNSKLQLRNFGCRVVCNQDPHVWSRGLATSEVGMFSGSNIEPIIVKQSRITEITELEGEEPIS